MPLSHAEGASGVEQEQMLIDRPEAAWSPQPAPSRRAWREESPGSARQAMPAKSRPAAIPRPDPRGAAIRRSETGATRKRDLDLRLAMARSFLLVAVQMNLREERTLHGGDDVLGHFENARPAIHGSASSSRAGCGSSGGSKSGRRKTIRFPWAGAGRAGGCRRSGRDFGSEIR